jgi:hypothetical protein
MAASAKKSIKSRSINLRQHVLVILSECIHTKLYNDWKYFRYCQLFQLIDWLIIYGFTSRSRIFHLYGDVTIAGEGLQNLGLCSAFRAFEQGGIFIVPHLLWHGTSVFPVSSEGLPHLVASYDTRGMWRTYSNPDPHGGQLFQASYTYCITIYSVICTCNRKKSIQWKHIKIHSFLLLHADSAHFLTSSPSSLCHFLKQFLSFDKHRGTW